MNNPRTRPSLAPQGRRWAFRLIGALLFSASVVGSMGVGECSPTAGGKVVGEACTRSNECLRGLVCQSGVCAETDAGIQPTDAALGFDAPVGDAGTNPDAR